MASRCSCCSCRTFIIIMKIFLGLALTGMCVYLHIYMPVIRMRETPFWAGVPLLIAGLLAIGFMFNSQNKSKRASSCLFVVKIMSVVCATIAIFTCLTSLVFIVIHLIQLFTYTSCTPVANGCLCVKSHDSESQSLSDTDGRLYKPVEGCFQVFCQMIIFIGSTGVLCLLGCVFAVSFVVSVWRSVYGSTSSPPPPSSSQEFLSPSSSLTFSSAHRIRPVSAAMSTTTNDN